MMKCGNDIQWTDFRVGTKGGMLLKWPSGIFSTCNNVSFMYLRLLKQCLMNKSISNLDLFNKPIIDQHGRSRPN